MLARPKIVTGNSARNYFEIDTYYINNEFEQGSFYGKLKNELGLKEFNLKDFDSLLKAQDPRNGIPLLNLNKKDLDENGERKRAALDLTFAADKSISILYEVADQSLKQQIRDAFTKSIDLALDFAEANYSYAKSRDNIKGDKLAQSKLLFARFDHSESRNDDMHLHQHCLMMNIIKDENGIYRSMEFNQTMINHQFLGQIQRNKFAEELQKLGFEIEVTNAKNGTFGLKNISKNITEQFSSRLEDIKNNMKEAGQVSYRSTHISQKQTAKWKNKNKNRQAIQVRNIERLKEAGVDLLAIQKRNNKLDIRRMDVSDVINIAIEDITDKKSVFSKEDILKHSLKIALATNVTLEEIEKRFNEYENLIAIDKDENQYTTKEVIEKEKYIFSKNKSINFEITTDTKKVDKAIKEFERRKGFSLKDGQRNLAHIILRNSSQYIIAQGVAGPGKSTSLEIVKNVAMENNIRVIAIAPTGTAVDNLSKETGIKESFTVAKFIQAQDSMDIKNATVIIDEAGMLGLRDTYELIQIAEKNNLKLIFSGDSNQKKSIAQGDIFAGMQRQGFTTVYLDEGNRQKNVKMKNVVKNILNKDIIGVLNLLKDSTNEVKQEDERLAFAKSKYIEDIENSLLITTTNRDRKLLNRSIRNTLVSRGDVKDSKEFNTREIYNLSSLEKRCAIYYKKDEKVYLSKNIGSISAGREATIKNIDLANNTIEIQHKGKNKIFKEIVDLSIDGEKLNLYKDVKTYLGVGDKIIARKNDSKYGFKNGQLGTIVDISKDNATVIINKEKITFNIKQYPYIEHAYAITDFASQGKTTEKVVIVANSQSTSLNDFYTQITRAKYEAYIITDDLEDLQTRAMQESRKLNASELLNKIDNMSTQYSEWFKNFNEINSKRLENENSSYENEL